MSIAAIYKLPLPVWVVGSVLGKTYPTAIGQMKINVVMPQQEDQKAGYIAPLIDGVEIPDSVEGEVLEWAQRFAAFIPPSLEPAIALLRVVVTAEAMPVNPRRPWATTEDRLGHLIEPWFNQLRTWAEIFTGQDLDYGHRIYDAKVVGSALTFIEPPHDGDLGLILSTPRVRPISEVEWCLALKKVQDGEDPPLEELLSRDARAALRRGFHRRCIIDAATATEIVLFRIVNNRIDEVDAQDRKRAPKATLGQLVAIAKKAGMRFCVTYDDLGLLVEARNNALHRGQEPDVVATSRLLRVVTEFLGAHGSILRSDKPEDDGSDWKVNS